MLDRIRIFKPKYIMIGNIEQSIPTKALMGIMDWHLFDRSRWDLLELTMNKFPGAKVEVQTDITGHQHFLMVAL
jgi:hypothetical protein